MIILNNEIAKIQKEKKKRKIFFIFNNFGKNEQKKSNKNK